MISYMMAPQPMEAQLISSAVFLLPYVFMYYSSGNPIGLRSYVLQSGLFYLSFSLLF